MRRLSILKTLTSIMFIVSMIVMLFSIPFIIILSLMPERVPFKFTIKGVEEGAKVNAELILYIIALVIAFGFFTYALYLFKKVLDLFSKKILFDTRVITNLDQCGKAILIGYIIGLAAEVLYRLITSNVINISLDLGLTASIAIISLGLFFIVLAEVFLMAKNLKEETI